MCWQKVFIYELAENGELMEIWARCNIYFSIVFKHLGDKSEKLSIQHIVSLCLTPLQHLNGLFRNNKHNITSEELLSNNVTA